jgi:3-oxoadipate enol-lactonase
MTAPLNHEDSETPGEAVLLSHAIGMDRRMWDGLVPVLQERFRVIVPDSRGHGLSPVPPRPYSLDAMADDARDLLDHLGIAKAHWVGLSMGGMVGMAFALRHPARLGRLVLANTTSTYGPEGPKNWDARIAAIEKGGLESIGDMVMQRYFSEGFRAREPQFVADTRARFLETAPQGYLGCCDAIRELDFSRDLGRIRAATLVIAGEEDIGTPVAMSEAIAKGIPGARLAVIPHAAHLSALEKPAQFARLVGDFLAAS